MQRGARRLRRATKNSFGGETLSSVSGRESAQGLNALMLDLQTPSATARRLQDRLDHGDGAPIDLVVDCESLSSAVRTSHDVSDSSNQLYINRLRDELASRRLRSANWVDAKDMMVDALTKVMTLAHVQSFVAESYRHLTEPHRHRGQDMDDGGGHSKEQARARRALKKSGIHVVSVDTPEHEVRARSSAVGAHHRSGAPALSLNAKMSRLMIARVSLAQVSQSLTVFEGKFDYDTSISVPWQAAVFVLTVCLAMAFALGSLCAELNERLESRTTTSPATPTPGETSPDYEHVLADRARYYKTPLGERLHFRRSCPTLGNSKNDEVECWRVCRVCSCEHEKVFGKQK